MHARHRSPGNGYRSNSMGMGSVPPTSRISPEGSVRGHGMYSPAYRNYNRGFGRGQPKPFQPPQPPPRRGDIFMEAGRLAAEYLVSKGLLPPNVLSGKWQNGSLKNQAGDFQGFRQQDGDNMNLPVEGRTSSLTRLGDSSPDMGSSRRRFPDEYNAMESRNNSRGRKRMGSFKSYGSEWNREIGRSESWSERARPSPDKDANDDAFSAYQNEQQSGKDGVSVVPNSRRKEILQKSDAAFSSEISLEKYQLPNDVVSKASSSSMGKDLPSEPEVEATESSAGVKFLNAVTGDVKNDSSNDGMEKQSATEDIPIQHCADEDNPASKKGSDLLGLCRFVKVPTKTRSSLTIRGSKIDPVLITEDENAHEGGLPTESGTSTGNILVEGSSVSAPRSIGQSLNCTVPEISKPLPEESAGKLGLENTVGQGKCTRSISFLERSFMIEQESSEGPPGFGRCSSMVMERGEKRASQHSDNNEGTKKPREWLPSIDAQMIDYSHLSNSREEQQTSQEGMISPRQDVTMAIDQNNSIDISLYPQGGAEPHFAFAEEKQLFPGSYKICDLNLMEASDVTDNHDADPVRIFPSIPQSNKDEAPVDIDLSMGSNCEVSDKYGMRRADGREVEVIDLESDAVQEDKAFNNSELKDETVFSGLESFPSHAQNVNVNPDGQDGYGLMISELLGNEIPNCASVPPDINSLQNEMGIHNGEGILGDDDSIYMSLGEIPISFLRVWEQQPTQEYEKPF